jgi:hypothetical protein
MIVFMFPGTDGGGEWGAAYDEESGLLFVNSNEQPWIIHMVTHETRAGPGGPARTSARTRGSALQPCAK